MKLKYKVEIGANLWIPLSSHMYPYTSYTFPVHLYASYTICSLNVMGTLGVESVHPYVLGSFGPLVHLSGISVSVITSIVSQFITAIPVAPHHCGLLLYWTGCLWMSAMLHTVVPFFVVFSLCLKLLLPWL